jgi:hypothetical protein
VWRPRAARGEPALPAADAEPLQSGSGRGAVGEVNERTLRNLRSFSVDVRSEPGAGATFVVWLPRTGDPGDAPDLDPTRGAALV